ncbi:MAG TPA: HD domain-containing phosphohydrolase [Desulfotignum sp.]|nr:HD domain-containing phosphohydrolase [Desulfotignum sp.]
MTPDYHQFFTLFARISKKIHANSDTRDILACIVENITRILSAKGSIFWILNTDKQCIETKIFHGFDYRSLMQVDYPTLMALFENRKKNCVTISNTREDDRIPDLERLGKRKINSVTGLFFDIAGPYTGLLAVYFTGNRTLAAHELELVTALGEQGAIALEKAMGHDRKLLDIYRSIVEGFALAIEARDQVTHGHSRRVAVLAKLTARQMGLDEAMVKNIFHAGILHDIGKIGTRDTVLDRLGHLTPGEMKQMRQHPVLGAEIILPLTFFNRIAPMIRHHHERFDGSGYPDGIKGEDIPLGARILAVCDVFETMTAGRPGMPPKDLSSAISALKHGVGTLFDPAVVQAFFAVIQAHPRAMEIHASIDDVLDMLRQNVTDLALQNRLEKRTARLFPAGF